MEKYNEVWIHGSAINLDDPNLLAAKSIDDIKATSYFEHLSDEKREEGEDELWKAVKENNKKPKSDLVKGKVEKKGPTVMGTGKTKDELDKE